MRNNPLTSSKPLRGTFLPPCATISRTAGMLRTSRIDNSERSKSPSHFGVSSVRHRVTPRKRRASRIQNPADQRNHPSDRIRAARWSGAELDADESPDSRRGIARLQILSASSRRETVREISSGRVAKHESNGQNGDKTDPFVLYWNFPSCGTFPFAASRTPIDGRQSPRSERRTRLTFSAKTRKKK